MLKEKDFEVVVVRSLNEITDDIYDLEEFVKTIKRGPHDKGDIRIMVVLIPTKCQS